MMERRDGDLYIIRRGGRRKQKVRFWLSVWSRKEEEEEEPEPEREDTRIKKTKGCYP
jgi:hypothetical protein